MSLPSVEWRYVGTRAITTGTIDVVMDNIYTLATGTGYIDGTARSQGSGSAGSWSRYQTGGGITEAIYVTPPSGSQKIIIAGSSGSFTPTMASPDSYVANSLMVNITKNPGNFLAWNSGNPFTSGNAFGYYRFLGSRSANAGITSFTGSVYLYESKESIAVFLITSTGASSTSFSNGFLAGALWDAESSDPADVESDGRIYGLITSGHYNANGNAWNSNYAWGIDQFNTVSSAATDDTGFLCTHIASAAAAHMGAFSPGTGTVKNTALMLYPLTVNSSASLVTPSGKFARIPLIYRYSATTQITGRLREVSLCQRGLIGQRHTSGVTTIGSVVSCSDFAITSADAILLEY